ncbi:hypothetical protein [Vibrio coralliilyticus]|jgi:hypothetical protein|uniref:hypothetical protein n=1 Tax=Vibrio coralliilyticus TaxID=190893 RepID=UPI0015611A3B|nr:hypothetical protein [Vibrio coralliilyticus]NRF62106.1 hypothetical protein [Vibrio coralliilyticus]
MEIASSDKGRNVEKAVVYYDEEFKNKYIAAIERLTQIIEGFETECDPDELKKSVYDTFESVEAVSFVIHPDEQVEVYSDSLSSHGESLIMLQKDLVELEHDLEIAQLINHVEYFTPTLYMHRVSTMNVDEDKVVYFDFFKLDAISDDIKVYFSPECSFHFSYMLGKDQTHKEPVSNDAFVVIRGEHLTLEKCRRAYKSYVFEANAVSNIIIESCPNEPFDLDGYLIGDEPDTDGFYPVNRQLIMCDDTEKVIDLYNKALYCDDDEVSILFYSKVVEFVSETVVRAKVTDEVRKALSSNKALNPDANFVKDLQNLFKDHSYQKDADSIKLTVQTCGYMKDLTEWLPHYIEKKVNTESKKGDVEGLGCIADYITATRNSIAHAKSNYRFTGREVPEEHYREFAELLRVVSQQCIRWYAAQSPLSRVK